ncbi:MAG TPA: hypothetical protein VFT82_00765 [Candidatus Paceibacterota bacterium]|nr:hypothetical protein [Candidatus Paceibacterota bacterium]
MHLANYYCVLYAILVFALGESLWLLAVVQANRKKWLTPNQMLSQGISDGIPFLAHGGMIFDPILVTPLSSLMIAFFGASWDPVAMDIAFACAFAASTLLHALYVRSPIKESLIDTERKDLTPAGWTHLFYMALMFMVIFLFFFATSGVPAWFAYGSAAALSFHVFTANHIPLSKMRFAWYRHGVPPIAYATVGVTACLLFWRAHAISAAP